MIKHISPIDGGRGVETEEYHYGLDGVMENATGQNLNTYFQQKVRIQSMCNEHHVKLLCSDELLQKMKYRDRFTRIPIGDIALRGKAGKVAVSTLEIQPGSA